MRRAPIAVLTGLALAGCFPSFGDLPDGAPARDAGPAADADPACGCTIDDGCQAEGAVDPADFCRECRPAIDPSAWTSVCTDAVHHTSYADFIAGDLGRSRARLYVSADGAVRTFHGDDVDGDGWADLLVTRPTMEPSELHLGGPDGFDGSRVVTLPASEARGATLADLDGDGRLDVVVSNFLAGGITTTSSFVYWNAPGGFPAHATSLPTVGAFGSAVADLDRDGYLDVVFANHLYLPDVFTDTYDATSYVFWGGPGGYDPAVLTGLTTHGAIGVEVADLDDDGHLDLVFGNFAAGARATPDPDVDTFIYWGAPGRAFDATPTRLDTRAAHVPTILDLDADGVLDVLVSADAGSSFLFYGRGGRAFDGADTTLPAAHGSSAADLDGDGDLDLVLDSGGGTSLARSSGPRTFDVSPNILPLGYGDRVTHLDDDGVLDVALFSPFEPMPGVSPSSFVCAGPVADASDCGTQLVTGSAGISTTADPGHTYDRGPVEAYVSPAILIPAGSTPTRLVWAASAPGESRVTLQVRSARVREELADAEWRGPTGPDDEYERPGARLEVPVEHNHLQYRVALSTPRFASLPALESVTVFFGRPGSR